MINVLNCPYCGNKPRFQKSDPGYYDLKTWHCCSHAVYADTPKEWNEYVVAMELAKAISKYGNKYGFCELRIDGDDDDEEINYVNDCTKRVMRFFE